MSISKKLIGAIMGERPYDLVLKNANFVNVITNEVYPADIGIVDGKIGHVTQPGDPPLSCVNEYDATGKYAIPGLIDTHVHIESSMMIPVNLAMGILPHGTTTIACDPHEIANVMGVEGIRYMVEASRDLPLQTLFSLPSCVPSCVGVETSGAEITGSDIEKMAEWERVIGLGEVMDFYGVIQQDGRIMDVLEAAQRKNLVIEGHCPTLTGRNLSAYLAAGIASCHETSVAEEARYKLRAGMVLECRESSIAHDVAALVPVLKEFGYPETATFCTDDREPDDLLREGSINHVIRVAIGAGMPPIAAVKMATFNAARLLGQKDIGLIAPGRRADIVLLDDLEAFTVNQVFVQGELIAEQGVMLRALEEKPVPAEARNTIYLKETITPYSFMLPCKKPMAKVNVIEHDQNLNLITHLQQIELPVRDGFVDISGRDDLCMLTIFERHGGSGNRATCVLRNFGLQFGAIASSVSHDCHNLTVAGRDYQDMRIAAEYLQQTGGGIVCVADGKIEALVELPIAGLMSADDIYSMAPKTEKLKRTIRKMGISSPCPILQIASFSLAVIPHVRLTDMGLFHVDTQQFLLPVE